MVGVENYVFKQNLMQDQASLAYPCIRPCDIILTFSRRHYTFFSSFLISAGSAPPLVGAATGFAIVFLASSVLYFFLSSLYFFSISCKFCNSACFEKEEEIQQLQNENNSIDHNWHGVDQSHKIFLFYFSNFHKDNGQCGTSTLCWRLLFQLYYRFDVINLAHSRRGQ